MVIKSLSEKVLEAGGNELHMKKGSKPLMRIKNNTLKQMHLPAFLEKDMKDLVESSSNLGLFVLNQDGISFTTLIRSS